MPTKLKIFKKKKNKKEQAPETRGLCKNNKHYEQKSIT